jgi:hypothetical protein
MEKMEKVFACDDVLFLDSGWKEEMERPRKLAMIWSIGKHIYMEK